MQSLIIILPDSVNFEQLDQSWPSFLQAAENMPGLIKESVTVITETLSGTSSIARIYAFLFEDNPSLIQALSSPQGEKAGRLIHQLSGGKAIILTGQYREDSLENLKKYHSASHEE
ncbi:MAG: hypothetical protein U5K99_00605 [Anaerolineales bacterium]|nr:hypothetical protein [Anaerolineales bacterium]